MVISFIRTGWPQKMAQLQSLQGFYMVRARLSKSDGPILYQDRSVIPATQRAEILQQIYESHQGQTKRRERARMSVWWPAINMDIAKIVKTCTFCVEHRPTQKTEPLKTTPLIQGSMAKGQGRPVWAWGQEIPHCNGLLFQRQWNRPPIYYHKPTSRGIPLELVNDNSMQFTSAEFQDFSEWGCWESCKNSQACPQATRSSSHFEVLSCNPHLCIQSKSNSAHDWTPNLNDISYAGWKAAA